MKQNFKVHNGPYFLLERFHLKIVTHVQWWNNVHSWKILISAVIATGFTAAQG